MTTTQSSPPQEFTLFPLLPPELRHKIWLFSLPTTPRLIPYASTETPPIATVSVESREIFLSVYTKCFHPASATSSRLLPYPISPYANLHLDTLFLFWDCRPSNRYPFPLEEWMTADAIKGIKRVALGIGLWVTLRLHMLPLEGLEELTFVMGMGHRHEVLRDLRHEGQVVEIGEGHEKWEGNRGWWLDLNEAERKGWEKLKVTLAEIVLPAGGGDVVF